MYYTSSLDPLSVPSIVSTSKERKNNTLLFANIWGKKCFSPSVIRLYNMTSRDLKCHFKIIFEENYFKGKKFCK